MNFMENDLEPIDLEPMTYGRCVALSESVRKLSTFPALNTNFEYIYEIESYNSIPVIAQNFSLIKVSYELNGPRMLKIK